MESQTQAATTKTPIRPNRRALFFIFLTAFLNAIGLTIIIPLAPFLVAQYVSDANSIGLVIGVLTAVYAFCQFVAAPGLGALSDRFGRRPILLLCLFGSAIGYLLFGVGGALWVLFLGRIIDGLTGANGAILNAYVADIVQPSERGKYYGWIGAITGISVVIGPAIGGVMANFGMHLPFLFAGGIALANVLFGLFFLPESLSKEQRTSTINIARLNPFSTLKDVLSMPQIRWLLAAMFLTTLAFVAITANVSLFTKDNLNWDPSAVGVLFSVFGVTSIIGQAVLLPWVLNRLSASQTAMIGLGIAVVGFLVIALDAAVAIAPLMYIAIVLFAIGEGLISPCLLDLLSRSADASSQGKVQGGNQSIQALASMFGPLLVGELYDHLGHASPYLSGALTLLLALGALLVALPTLTHMTTASADQVLT